MFLNRESHPVVRIGSYIMASKAQCPHCCVCKKPYKYKGIDPYLLPCLHAACAGCISVQRETITCLLCRESFDKEQFIFLNDTVTQVETLATTLKHKPSEIKCTNKDHSLDAVSWCKDCESFFCQSCQAAHNQVRSSSTHGMVSLKDMKPADVRSQKSLCPDHESYALDLYDETCEIIICSKCARSNHKHCKTEELDEAAGAVEEDTIEDKSKLAAKLQHFKDMIDESNTKQETMKERHNDLKDLLSQRFNSIRDLITKREAELRKTLEFRHLSEMDEAARVSNKLRRIVRLCKNTHDYTGKLLEHGNTSDILMLRKYVKFRTEMALSEEAEMFEIVPVHVTFSKEKIQSLENVLQTVCDIETKEGDDGSFMNLYANFEGPNSDTETSEKDPQAQGNYLPMFSTVDESKLSDLISETEPLDMDPDTEEEKEREHNEENEEDNGEELITGNPALSYPALSFDVERINNNKVHVNNKGFLVNSKVSQERKLGQYVGTTAITPLPKDKVSYWEVESDFNVASEMQQHGLLMEIGVARGACLDNSYCMSGQKGSMCLAIAHCSTHKGVCAKIWSNGQKMRCYENVLSTSPGTSDTLRHGLLFDGTRNTLTIFDLNTIAELVTLDTEEQADDLWPVFGAYNSSLAAVQMKVVSGKEINILKSKTKMLKGAME
ncbi:tripartite motif-containing protein 45-like [Haliotis rufescens]|uniref:tripartite motif-containing protein 45-like n=1 Tax=Haliotis rufescens TaxID=6454 RepID=UPI00201EE308|nr:tripartite motif-containing protein 45-like [Haliotis rufescens]